MSVIDAAAPSPGARDADAVTPSVIHVACAWLMLAMIHCTVALVGFPRLYWLIRRWPTVGVVDAADVPRCVARTCAAMTRARIYYFKYTWCLHSAAAAVALLRLGGVAAEFVIGVRRIPFQAHAWVEVNDHVVLNGRRDLDVTHTVISRC